MSVGEIKGESVKSAIALKIKAAFTTGSTPNFVYPTIYKEQVPQGLVKPYFFIWLINLGSRKGLGNQYWLTYQMKVEYETADNDLSQYENVAAVGLKLLESLRTINVPISLNGTTETTIPAKGSDLSWQIVEGVMQFFATYTLKIKLSEEEAAAMAELLITESVT